MGVARKAKHRIAPIYMPSLVYLFELRVEREGELRGLPISKYNILSSTFDLTIENLGKTLKYSS